MSIVPTVQVTLTVDFVGSGGNTGAGQYFYSFDPRIVHIAGVSAQLNYALAADADPNIVMERVFTTDAKNQLSAPVFSDDRRSFTMTHANTEAELIMMSVLVRDTARKVRINCDPQITNAPGDGLVPL